MVNRIRRTLGIQVARFRFRKIHDTIMNFTTAVSSARHVLLVMPLSSGEFLPTVTVITMLKERFGEENLTIVTGNRGLEVMRMLPRSQFVHLLPHDISLVLLPRPDVIERIRRRTPDVAIDLNLDLVLPSGYICRASGARVRIGFSRMRADVFYNFQIQTDPTLGRKLVYDRLAKCLQMF